MEKATALILGGGSIKGAWQAGAIKAVLGRGHEPEMIAGISVGSMNGTFLANEAGKYRSKGEKIDWPRIGERLVEFWKEEITGPDKLVKRKGTAKLVWKILRKRFDGLTDTTPLRDLVERTLDLWSIRESGLDLKVGCVNLNSGEILYAEPHYSNFLEYVIGSTAIPFLMPPERIGGQTYVDGGVVDSAPLGEAVKSDRKRVIAIGCHPEKPSGVTVDPGDAVRFADRIMDLISANNLNNDIDKAFLFNNLLEASNGEHERVKERHSLDLRVIRPEVPIEADIMDFDPSAIEGMLEDGEAMASHVLDEMR